MKCFFGLTYWENTYISLQGKSNFIMYYSNLSLILSENIGVCEIRVSANSFNHWILENVPSLESHILRLWDTSWSFSVEWLQSEVIIELIVKFLIKGLDRFISRRESFSLAVVYPGSGTNSKVVHISLLLVKVILLQQQGHTFSTSKNALPFCLVSSSVVVPWLSKGFTLISKEEIAILH